MSSLFSRLHRRLQAAIGQRLKWTSLRPVQELSGQALLDGKNAVILAPTAGGKTEASMFPAFSLLLDQPTPATGILYIAPIKALLNNQAERLGEYAEMVGMRRQVWHGDISASEKKTFTRDPCELLMTTPESLEVMLISKRVDAAAIFRDLRMVVIDEVHALAGSDRGAHLMSVLERIATLTRHDLQRVGLSATVGNPDAILTWLKGSSKREGAVIDPPKVPAKRELAVVHRPEIEPLAVDAARLARGRKSLFFCQSRALAEEVAGHMRTAGIETFVHHSSVSKEERARAEDSFHRGSNACIVCTSTLELGIDVGDLDRVLQCNAPDTVSSFLQRMGRTGRRAGQSANTFFLCESTEALLQALALVDLAREGWVESVEVSPRVWPVLLQQLFAMALERDGIALHEALEHFGRVPDFRGIGREEVEALVSWLLENDGLYQAGDRLVLGDAAERVFGRRNFMELYAVFSSPVAYQVETLSGRPLGTLNQDFVDRLVPGETAFLLGGRPWVPIEVDHSNRRIKASPGTAGRKPAWGGFLPQFLGFDLCQRILRLLRSEEIPPILDGEARARLAEARETFQGGMTTESGGFEIDDGKLVWWTFAGGRINSTLRYVLEALQPGLSAAADNFAVRIKGIGLSGLLDRIVELQLDETWQSDELWRDVLARLPNYRLSKFQPFLTASLQRELLVNALLDVPGTRNWLGQAGVLAKAVVSSVRSPGPDRETAIGEDSGLAARIMELAGSAASGSPDADSTLPDESERGAASEELQGLLREWVSEAVWRQRTTAGSDSAKPEERRWPRLCARLAKGLRHPRIPAEVEGALWLPADPSESGIRRLMTLALQLARRPMPERFARTPYPGTDLDGLEDFLVVLFDLSERQETGALPSLDRSNLARAAAQLVEPLFAKTLGLLEEQAFGDFLEKRKAKGKGHLVGLSALATRLRVLGRAPLDKAYEHLMTRPRGERQLEDGWEQRPTWENCLRDLYFLRNRFGHKAPRLTEGEAESARLSALVVVLGLVDGNRAELDDV